MQFWNNIVLRASKKSAHTTLWLLKIILPISLLVRFLDYYGLLAFMADFLDPVFVFMELPGSTAIVFITSIFLPLYAPLAIITSMTISLRELTVLALGVSIWWILGVRFVIAWIVVWMRRFVLRLRFGGMSLKAVK